MKIINSKHQALVDYISKFDSLAIAFSGGVDSTLLLRVAHDVLGDKCIAITTSLPAVPASEQDFCKNYCADNNITWAVVDAPDITVIPHFTENPVDRCYHCKKWIFERIIATANSYSITNLAEGSNTDDVSDYRPGMIAIKELGVLSPLKEAGLSKTDIRELSKALGLVTHNKPATPCLATRVPYGETITAEKLKQIELGEQYLTNFGITNCRVRINDSTARIEVPVADLDTVVSNRELIIDKFKEIGFSFISLDLEGFKSGSMNRLLTNDERNIHI